GNGSTDWKGNWTVTIGGPNLANTRSVLDGAQEKGQVLNSDGSLPVTAPPATSGYKAVVEALAPDGQTSLLAIGSAAPPVFTYGGEAFPAISVSPATVAAGTDTMIEITGFRTKFVDGHTGGGFGSSDISVRKIWGVNPGRLLLNISVNPNAPVTSTTVSVANGLQLATLTATFQVTPAVPAQMTLRTPILSQTTHLAGVPAGGVAEIRSSGLPQSLSGWT